MPGLLLLSSVYVQAATLEVVATTPDLRSLVETIGRQQVQVSNLIAAGSNAETYQPRPQDIQSLQHATLVVRIGLDYDLWLDPLLKKTGRNDIRRGGTAHVDTSNGIALLEIRAAALDASSGHGHGGGNPHYWLDPHNAEIISTNILNGLLRVDPGNSKLYEKNHQQFVKALRSKSTDWQNRMATCAGKPVLAYHDSWAYFARRYRLHVVDIIEPKPGIPPSPARLASLFNTIRQQQVAAIIKQPYDPDNTPRLLADKTGVPVVVLASSVGALPQAPDYLAMMDYNITTLAAALAAARQ